jgi:hypothetical protein
MMMFWWEEGERGEWMGILQSPREGKEENEGRGREREGRWG